MDLRKKLINSNILKNNRINGENLIIGCCHFSKAELAELKGWVSTGQIINKHCLLFDFLDTFGNMHDMSQYIFSVYTLDRITKRISLSKYIKKVPDLRYDMVKFLIDLGLEVNSIWSDSYIKDPIISAAKRNRLDIVQLLYQRGGGLNNDPDLHQTHLFYAIKNDNLEIVKFLVDNGAKFHFVEEIDSLLLCISYKRYAIAEFLMSKGVSLPIDSDLDRALKRCMERNDFESVAFINRHLQLVN